MEDDGYFRYNPKKANYDNTKIDSIVRRNNVQYDSTSGNSFSNKSTFFTTIIQDRDFIVGDSLKLVGNIKLTKNGALVDPVKFNGSAHSLLKSIQISLGGQMFVNLTESIGQIAQFRRNTSLSQTEYAQSKLTCLEDVNLNPAVAKAFDFEISLDIYGLIKKIMGTADVAKLEVKIQFDSNLANVFNCAYATGTGSLTGYELDNVHLNSETITYTPTVAESTLELMRSQRGVEMPAHSYQASTYNLLDSTNQQINATATYTNLTSAWVLPVPLDIVTNDSGCAESDHVSTLTYIDKNYPKELYIKVGSNGAFVNMNGSSGVSNKMQHFRSVLKTVDGSKKADNVAWKLSNLYETDDYQVVAGSWLKGLSNSASILDSGMNTYADNGLVKIKFKTDVTQAPAGGVKKAALCIFEYTSILKISQGQIEMIN